MKYFLLTVALLCQAGAGFSQYSEFTIHKNGLIYSDSTIGRLKFIVDSLHIKYRNCDLNKTYYSLPQTRAHCIVLDTGDIVGALKDIQANLSFNDLLKKYPLTQADSNALITRREDSSDKSKWIVYDNQTSSIDGIDDVSINHDTADFVNENDYDISGRSGKWVYEYDKPTSYSRAKLSAFYFERPFAKKPLPEKYGRLVLYSDCMIDTLTNTFRETAKGEERYLEEQKLGPRCEAFINYLKKKIGYPHANHFLFSVDKKKEAYIKKHLSVTPEFKKLLAGAVEESVKGEYITNEWFENCVAMYYSKKAALDIKRNRIVSGRCSMDSAPREHTLEIALLAADAAEWPVFLRTHLDIMNDNMHRAIDASYAKAHRNTYIKELEVLDINVQDLMLAISIRIDNPASNHYYGSISRLGRALAESGKRDALEQKIISCILDNELDEMNRVVMHNLYLNYIYYLEKKDDRLAGLQKLEEAKKQLPPQQQHLFSFVREYFENGFRFYNPVR